MYKAFTKLVISELSVKDLIGSRALSFSGPLLSVSVEFCLLVRERSALADPYCQPTWNSVGSRALSFSRPLLSVSVEFCLLVC